MIKWANYLLDNNQGDYVREHLWNHNGPHGGIINYDLDWVLDNWDSNGCDLWEEIRSNDIFWNMMAFGNTLKYASEFA